MHGRGRRERRGEEIMMGEEKGKDKEGEEKTEKERE